jgi:Rho guanine nucleotide exchange factor 4
MTRNENFTSEQIDRIFGNLDEILSFQRYFYNKLESVYHHENPSLSSFGKIFAQNCPSFKVYSKYCVNFNSAVNELTRLESLSTFADFFEECRVSRGLQQLKLADFLLQPIQRICKYPLHLTELQKHTEVYHTDCRSVNQALKDMKKMTHEINSERKSAEAKNSISEWQKDVSNWIGKDVNVKSKSILYTGKLSKCENFEDLDQIRWVTLFELQLIICKKVIFCGS